MIEFLRRRREGRVAQRRHDEAMEQAASQGRAAWLGVVVGSIGIVVAVGFGTATIVVSVRGGADGGPVSAGNFIEPYLYELPWWFTVTPVDELGVPPRFQLDRGTQEFHCREWLEWFRTISAVPGGETYVLVKAPSSTAVVITSVEIDVFRRRELGGAGAWIRCGYGADAYEASTATFSFSTNDSVLHLTSLDDTGGTRDYEIPPDQFRVEAGLSEVLALEAEGEPGVYEWSMTVNATVDQRPVRERIGTEEEPLLSLVAGEPEVGAPASGDPMALYEVVDWDLVECQWGQPEYDFVDSADAREWSCPS